MSAKKPSIYKQALIAIFQKHYHPGIEEFIFHRSEIEVAAGKNKIRNLGDLIYSFRYRARLPPEIANTAPAGKSWIIRPAGDALYRFVLTESEPNILPNTLLAEIKIPDSTPGVIHKYALSDEQALLAQMRYTRFVDIFTGVACYSLQNHLRTRVPEWGQMETDEIYIGIDRGGVHHVFPVQAKGGNDRLSIIQVEQDIAMCGNKFAGLPCRPIAAQFMKDGGIAMFMFVEIDGEVRLLREMHYKLVPANKISADELQQYQTQMNNIGES